MNELQIFQSEEFGTIRTVTIDNEPWFVGKDVAVILGYTNPSKAIQDHVDEEDKLNSKTLSNSDSVGELNNETLSSQDLELGQRGGWLINESGLYSLVLGSKLESARRFKRWVTSEVLPAIRKTGGYIVGEKNMSDEELLSQALLIAQRKLTERTQQLETVNAKLEEAKPKIVFADAVSASKTSILIGDLAKILRQNGVEIGQKRLFDWLRKNGYLMKNGTSKNLPTQRYMEQALFEVKEHVVVTPSGENKITRTTKITPKGQIYFVNKLLAEKAEA